MLLLNFRLPGVNIVRRICGLNRREQFLDLNLGVSVRQSGLVMQLLGPGGDMRWQVAGVVGRVTALSAVDVVWPQKRRRF